MYPMLVSFTLLRDKEKLHGSKTDDKTTTDGC